jgi:hypothetical protein
MTIHAEWDDATQTILRFDFQNDWNWSELEAIDRELVAYQKQLESRLSYIADLQKSSLSAEGLNTPHLRQVPILLRPESEILVIVGGSHFTRSMIDIVRQAYGDARERVAVARSLDEARGRIAEFRLQTAEV